MSSRILCAGLACLLLPFAGRAEHDATHSTPVLEPAAAWAQARQAAEREPASVRAWARLAGAAFRNGDFEGAEHAARKALLLDPENADALVALARCLETLGDSKGAREQLEKAVRIAPDHATALRLMAGKVDLNADREKALRLTRRFIEENPPDQAVFVEHARQMVALLQSLGNLPLSRRPPFEEQPERIELPMRLDTQGVSIELQVGQEKRRFTLDTGEESMTIRSETARALGCRSLAELPAVRRSRPGKSLDARQERGY